jgi:hypothetical protein
VRHAGQLTGEHGPMSKGQYRLLAAGGAELEAGSGEVTVTAGVLELRPATGAALRLPPDRIASVSEPEPFTVLITLEDGTGVELSRLGVMRTQILAELKDARAGAAAREAGAVGAAERFAARIDGDPADLRVYEDALMVMAGGRAARIAFSFIDGVRTRDYTVSIAVAGGDPLEVSRLGRRTGEFATLLGERLQAARGRTAAFLGSLLPGLDPIALRAAAALLRDGLAVPTRALDAIHPQLSATLLRVATLPDRAAGVQSLAQRADLAIGYKQVASVRRAAVGATPWHDPAATPHIGQHDSPGGLFGGGLSGAMAAGLMEGMGPGRSGYGYGGGFGDFGGYWAYRALGSGMNWGSPVTQHQMTPRADLQRGLLTPETEDLAALTTAGQDPTVLAFALISQEEGRRIGYEVLNLAEPVTFVYEATGRQDPMTEINRALDDAGFAAGALAALSAGSGAAGGLTSAHRQDVATSPLASGLVGQVPHGPEWARQVADLLAGTG